MCQASSHELQQQLTCIQQMLQNDAIDALFLRNLFRVLLIPAVHMESWIYS